MQQPIRVLYEGSTRRLRGGGGGAVIVLTPDPEEAGAVLMDRRLLGDGRRRSDGGVIHAGLALANAGNNTADHSHGAAWSYGTGVTGLELRDMELIVIGSVLM